MIIIEFCGSPGCGKSTLCDQLESYLKETGLRVENLRIRQPNTTIVDRIRKVIYISKLRIVTLKYPLRKVTMKYAGSFSNKKALFWGNRLIEGYYRIKDAEKRNVQIGLFDEGFIQYITSISYGKELDDSLNELLCYITKKIYNDRTLVFHCSLDPNINIERLKKRNRIDRYFSGTDDEIANKLAFKINQISYLCNNVSNCMVVDLNTEHFNSSYETIIECVKEYTNSRNIEVDRGQNEIKK